MNDDQLKRSWRIGLVALALISILQICYLAYYGHFLSKQGLNLWEMIADPPASLFVAVPSIGLGVAACLGGWVLSLAMRRSPGIVHVSICQLVLLLLAIHLTSVVLRTAGMHQLLISSKHMQRVIDEHDARYTERIRQLTEEARSQNQRSDGIVTNVPNHQP